MLDPPAHRTQRDERGTAFMVNRDFGGWATRHSLNCRLGTQIKDFERMTGPPAHLLRRSCSAGDKHGKKLYLADKIEYSPGTLRFVAEKNSEDDGNPICGDSECFDDWIDSRRGRMVL